MALKSLSAVFACAIALALAPAATAQTPSESPERIAAVDAQFTVLEANARVSFPSNLTRYQILDDDSLLLTFGANRHYRVKLYSDCARDLHNGYTVVIDTGGGGQFDRMSHIVVRGMRCAIDSVDRVEARAAGA